MLRASISYLFLWSSFVCSLDDTILGVLLDPANSKLVVVYRYGCYWFLVLFLHVFGRRVFLEDVGAPTRPSRTFRSGVLPSLICSSCFGDVITLGSSYNVSPDALLRRARLWLIYFPMPQSISRKLSLMRMSVLVVAFFSCWGSTAVMFLVGAVSTRLEEADDNLNLFIFIVVRSDLNLSLSNSKDLMTVSCYLKLRGLYTLPPTTLIL